MLLIGLSLISLLVGYLVFGAQKNNVGNRPNYFLGYRTPSSMKSTEAWDFAQKKFKIVFIKTQFLLLFIGSVWLIYDVLNFLQGISVVLQAVIYFLSVIFIIVFIEIQMKKFGKK